MYTVCTDTRNKLIITISQLLNIHFFKNTNDTFIGNRLKCCFITSDSIRFSLKSLNFNPRLDSMYSYILIYCS